MLALHDIAIAMADGTPLIRPFSLDVGAGETVTLMGPSGSGKSSLLSFIGGDLTVAMTGAGVVTLNGTDILPLPPERRRIARLFQDDLLFPHMTVGENLLFAIPKAPQSARFDKMQQALADAGLEGFANRPPHTLSGGQRARIALMRALLAEPQALLLDEPFSKLDRELRATIRSFTFAHIRARAIPALLVTHDPEDVPAGGRVLQIKATGEIAHV